MASEIRKILKDKKILVVGFGKEGRSTCRLLRSWFPESIIGVADSDESALEGIDDDSLELYGGRDYLGHCDAHDLVIKSPGVPYEKVSARCDPSRITSQTDLFLHAFGAQVIGITGTKGKSTTASLIHHIFRTAGLDTVLAGNIGVPPLDLAEGISRDTVVVFEMSSHQLEHISIAPQISVILNIFPEHLDHYEDFTAYKMAKFNISLMQPPGGRLVYNADDTIIGELVSRYGKHKNLLRFSGQPKPGTNAYAGSGRIFVSRTDGSQDDYDMRYIPDLPGDHNLLNAMAAALVCTIKDLPSSVIAEGLSSYRRLSHRLEFVGEFKGVSFYDDSIATIPQATVEALNTLGSVDMLILGGHERGLDYTLLYEKLTADPVRILVFMGEAGRRMYDEWIAYPEGNSETCLIGHMEEVEKLIREKLKAGDKCLLSPAAASYGMYRNFEERGDAFKKMAEAL
jgi:UDP-N-acetylmuramoylalanine--D-glutamate ligase